MPTLILDGVTEGMSVVDSEGQPVGKVALVRYGEGEAVPDFPIVMDILKDTLQDTRDFHSDEYLRFYKEGFVRITRGVLAPDLFAFSGQVSEVQDEDKVVLNVRRDELLES
jgi:hypothetical protein